MKETIQKWIEDNQVCLFMKGSKDMPLCGFSAQVVHVLDQLGVDYVTYDVLQDENLRASIKEFSNWPTLPQLYIQKEFIGGCDIVIELFKSGELKEKLEKIKSGS